MNIHIRTANPEDMPSVWAMVMELAIYEKAPEQVITNPKEMVRDGFGERPLFQCLVAENEDKTIVGIALYYFAYSTWKGKILYLDDLVVNEAYRRLNIGEKLFASLVDFQQKPNPT